MIDILDYYQQDRGRSPQASAGGREEHDRAEIWSRLSDALHRLAGRIRWKRTAAGRPHGGPLPVGARSPIRP
jgi:hypothetical protein